MLTDRLAELKRELMEYSALVQEMIQEKHPRGRVRYLAVKDSPPNLSALAK